MRVMNRPNIFVDQGQFSDPDFISGTHQRGNVKFANNYYGNSGVSIKKTQQISNLVCKLCHWKNQVWFIIHTFLVLHNVILTI
jgi:hypothetical protein